MLLLSIIFVDVDIIFPAESNLSFTRDCFLNSFYKKKITIIKLFTQFPLLNFQLLLSVLILYHLHPKVYLHFRQKDAYEREQDEFET